MKDRRRLSEESDRSKISTKQIKYYEAPTNWGQRDLRALPIPISNFTRWNLGIGMVVVVGVTGGRGAG